MVALSAEHRDGLRVLAVDGELEVIRMLCDRRDELSRMRIQTVNRIHRLIAELVPGTKKKNLSAQQAKAILATVRPRDIAGKTRRRMVAELIEDLVRIDRRLSRRKQVRENLPPIPISVRLQRSEPQINGRSLR